ncbi:MAG: hypothetical protein NW217_13680 [Hyphomicrobiaceae bacterium]|nr:hypothetical protein [Hyphomicrobiaceae bacterium]
MSKHSTHKSSRAAARTLGAKTFAAIAAVEGLRLSASSKKRLASLRASELTPDERRAEVLRAYSPPKGRR